MEKFIDKKLRQVFEDFQREAKRAGGLCECKGLTYEGGKLPKYSSPLVQQHYMLRFFPAYLAEYYLMYKNMLRQEFLAEILKVLSIGCGCGIDFWGLYFALKDSGKNPGKLINYTGVDIIAWQYQDNLGVEKVWFFNQDITQWTKMDERDYNVIVLPKSIGEFSESAFEKVCNIFINTKFSEEKICGLCSLMDKGKESDADRFLKIAKIMQDRHGFTCLDKLDQYWTVTKEKGIRGLCSNFVYPDDILEKVKSSLNECPTFSKNEEPCKDNCGHLNRSPILKTSFINYNMLRFQR